ncbi:MAG TPA: hypothetical protein VK936_00575 [Longimicrobiales bacterium]|nr:hypothetical protein [Longimicrobiales bacterium]
MTRYMRTGAVLLCAALAAGCSDGGGSDITTPPQPGFLTAVLTTPHADDAAVLVEITGAGITTVDAGGSGHTVHGRVSGATLRAAAFGEVRSGLLVRFAVPDVNRSGSYSARIIEASGPDNALRADVSGYRVDVTRP